MKRRIIWLIAAMALIAAACGGGERRDRDHGGDRDHRSD